MASEKPADLDLHCFQKQDISVFCLVGLNLYSKSLHTLAIF